MPHRPSDADVSFQDDFEKGRFKSLLSHRAHVQLAYIYLTQLGTRRATAKARESIQNYFCYRGIDEWQYNETLTQAWILAVRHSMETTPATESSEQFLEHNPQLLDSNTILTHYTSDLLFSDRAREAFAEPNLDPIPRYAEKN